MTWFEVNYITNTILPVEVVRVTSQCVVIETALGDGKKRQDRVAKRSDWRAYFTLWSHAKEDLLRYWNREMNRAEAILESTKKRWEEAGKLEAPHV